jgi:CheY-like chemotaxis protein
MAQILVVEDEAVVQLLIRIVLVSAGHSVFEALDGASALDILETHPKPFDMIVLDFLMPKMNGFEFLTRLQNHPFRPPVMVLTAHPNQIPQGFGSVIGGYLTKPFKRQQLIDAVNHLLGESIPTPSYMEKHAETVTGYGARAPGED